MQHHSEVEAADALGKIYRQITAEIGKVIIGQEEVVKFVLISIFSNGHCLHLVGGAGPGKNLAGANRCARCSTLTLSGYSLHPT